MAVGSAMPCLALCVLVAWWKLLAVAKEFLPRWRQSKFPGGCAHAC
jgi:creatinine amidohydrolase